MEMCPFKPRTVKFEQVMDSKNAIAGVTQDSFLPCYKQECPWYNPNSKKFCLRVKIIEMEAKARLKTCDNS